LIIVFVFFQIRLYSQDVTLSDLITNIAEELASDESDPEAASLYIELLQELAENPVKINSGNEAELSRIFFLTDFQIKSLADYYNSSGEIVSPYEIANIPGFDRIITEMMMPFITLDSKNTSASDSAIFRSSFLSNISYKTSDNDTIAVGSPVKLLAKYRFISGNISGGLTAEKDQGEMLLAGSPPLPDFLSANLSLSGTRFIRRIVIGDYSARFGQGTNISNSIRSGLSLTSPGFLSGRDEIKPYTSSDENKYFRGIAGQFQLRNIGFSLFYSVKKTDATLNSSEGVSKDYIESLYKTGLHNSVSSLMKKDVISETSFGANLSWNLKNLKIGLTWSGNKFSLPLNFTDASLENIFDFNGNLSYISTIYYSGIIKKMIFTGEVSMDNRDKFAFVQGLLFRPADRLSINVVYRNYESGFRSFNAIGPGSSSGGDNLKGILGSFNFEAAKYLFLSAGCDLQYFRWLKYRCSAPSISKRKEIRIKYIPSERFTTEISYYERFNILDEQESIYLAKQIEMVSKAIKCSAKYAPAERLTLGTRFDLKVADPSHSKGMLLLQDINYSFGSLPVSLLFRYCIFKTSDWNSRIYTWENDLLYSYSMPALSGEGNRSYFMIVWKIWKESELRVKYGITTLSEQSISIKDSEDFRMQFRIIF
jgi:hypothetical protein